MYRWPCGAVGRSVGVGSGKDLSEESAFRMQADRAGSESFLSVLPDPPFVQLVEVLRVSAMRLL